MYQIEHMLYRDICKTLSFYMWILVIPLSIPFVIAVYCEWIVGPEVYPQPPAAMAFLLTIIVTLLLGGIFRLVGRKGTGQLFRREALVCWRSDLKIRSPVHILSMLHW